MNTSNSYSIFLNTKFNEFIEKLKGGYNDKYLCLIYKCTISNAINYCLKNNITLSINIIDEIILHYYEKNTRYKKRKRALLRFINFIDNDEYQLKHQYDDKIILTEYYKSLNNDFFDYLISSNTKEITALKKVKINKLFLKWLENKEIFSIKHITKNNVYDFLNQLNHYSSEYRRKIRETMKFFLNWLNLNEKINFNGNNTIFNCKTIYTTLPSYYSIEEIKEAINKVDKDTIIGKRDYLVLLLLSQYGFRAGDLLNLKIQDLYFNNNLISLVQNKTKTPISVVMFEEVRYALIDYLKNSRPTTNEDFLFVSYKLKHEKYKNVAIFGSIVSKYLKLANISTEGKHHSSHSLRHSLATNMLLLNTPITSIEGVLGHNNIASTEMYLQLDFSKLEVLCLEVPYEL